MAVNRPYKSKSFLIFFSRKYHYGIVILVFSVQVVSAKLFFHHILNNLVVLLLIQIQKILVEYGHLRTQCLWVSCGWSCYDFMHWTLILLEGLSAYSSQTLFFEAAMRSGGWEKELQ
jgi:hypothetical protein